MGSIWAAAWTGGMHWRMRMGGSWASSRDQRQGTLECGAGNGRRSVKSKPNRRYRLVSEKTGRPCEICDVSTEQSDESRFVWEKRGLRRGERTKKEVYGHRALSLRNGVRERKVICLAHAGPKLSGWP